MNTVRSAMAEGILKKISGNHVYVDSVGIRNGEQDGYTIEVMKEIDVDLSKHRSKTFAALDDTSFDLIISLSPEAHHAALELTRWMSCEVTYWPTFDPDAIRGRREAKLEGFRQIRDDLVAKIYANFSS
jgi:protein-tyrosine-phosphatase